MQIKWAIIDNQINMQVGLTGHHNHMYAHIIQKVPLPSTSMNGFWFDVYHSDINN